MTIQEKIASKKIELESYLNAISQTVRDAEQALQGIPVVATIDASTGYELNWGPLRGKQRIFVTGIIEAWPLIECPKDLRALLVPYINELFVEVDRELELYLQKIRK